VPAAGFGQWPIPWPIRSPCELPTGGPFLWLVGESHDVPDRLFVDVPTSGDLLVDLEGERRVGVSDLRGDPFRVAAGDGGEGRPGAS